ncbi:histidine kinase [Kineococcus endophyticus]|uniref:histidine kinase n=1 Tax=Kineococcus endophyticus TaxID=1181883 RepID=A0ABV3P803_9ACTN
MSGPVLRTLQPHRGAVLAAVGFAVVGVALHLLGVTGGRGPAVLLPLLVVCTAHLTLARAPVATAVLATAAGAASLTVGPLGAGDSPADGPGDPVVLFALGNVLHGAWTAATPARRAWLEAGGAVLVVVGAGWALTVEGPGTALGVACGLAALLLLPQWWARDVDRGAQLARERAARERQAERLATARDLHDVVAGHLSGIALQTEAALVAARAGGADTTVLAGVRTASVEALQQMRVLVDVLRTDDPARPVDGPVPTLAAAVELARAAGLQVRTDWPADLAAGTDPRLPAGAPSPAPVAVVAHRVLTEALTNARKHAAAGPVTVQASWTADLLLLRVDSPLAPRRTAGPAGEGAGLRGVRERVAAVGGTVRAGADAADPALWRLEARLPASAPVSAVTVSPVGAR